MSYSRSTSSIALPSTSRRSFLRQAAGCAIVGAAGAGLARPVLAAEPSKLLSFDHTHTGEKLALVYAAGGQYLNDALSKLNRFLRDHYTGDVGVMDARGYVRITDRIKDMFITGGFNVYPAEIESLLYGHGQIAQVAVVGIPDERQGEVGKAFIVPVAGAKLTPEAIIAWCREHMANYKVPRRVEIVDALPMNASGKVLKYELRRR